MKLVTKQPRVTCRPTSSLMIILKAPIISWATSVMIYCMHILTPWVVADQ